jgi:hypothetical protein
MRLRYAIILVGVSFGGSEFWWGDQGGCGFYVSVLPELFVYTMVYTYWLPSSFSILSKLGLNASGITLRRH